MYPFGLQHRQIDDAVLDLVSSKQFAGDVFELRPVLVQISKCLVLGRKCRLKAAGLPSSAYCKNEGDRLPFPGQTPFVVPAGGFATTAGCSISNHITTDVVRVGVSYKLSAPAVARY